MPIVNKTAGLFEYLVCNKIKEGLGLSECRHFFSGAAPIMLDVKEFFAGLDIPICEVRSNFFPLVALFGSTFALFFRLTA